MFKLSSSNSSYCVTAGTYLCVQSFVLVIVLRWVKSSDINNLCLFPFIICMQNFTFQNIVIINLLAHVRRWDTGLSAIKK